jgi:acyl-coenzyme A thioesterase PaaI-like protein
MTAEDEPGSLTDADRPAYAPANNWPGGDFQLPPRPDGAVALCGACRRLGRCRLGLTREQLDDDGVAHFQISCPADHEGGPNVAHGGWTASVLDEALGHLPLMRGQVAVTGTLTVRYLKPVPIERPLVARAWVVSVDGVKWYISGALILASSGALLATAEGVWIARDHATHFGGFDAWLREQDTASAPPTPPSASHSATS